MSTTIDSKVVEMRFDNKHFENNVQTSMSTLEKLKQKLNLSGATKGLENVNAAAKNVNMSGLGSAVESVQAKFSALQVIGVTALANITNSAVNAGKRIVSALTIDPVKTGLSEYETKINAVQVIQANTRTKYTAEEIASGKQMADITNALEELNTYADKTIYNFAQMTSNVGKFVAQGLDVKQATNAVQGMANLAAASGASAEDMARATYQISQSLSSTIKLMDWNSLRNANMATVDLKNTLIDLAKVNGVAIDDMIAKHGDFEHTLSEGWLTGEMFTEAMNIYSGVYSDAELKAKGFTDAQIENFKSLAKSAESAATEVKTFTQLWDVLKETAQSGWTQTWELIIGDFTEAKETLTALQIYFSDIINKWSNARNFLVGGVMDFGSLWSNIEEKLGINKLRKIGEVAKSVTHDLEYFQDVVTKVWRGDYNNAGDNPDRFDLLRQAGYDDRVVQDLVNKGYGYKLTMEDVEASHKKFGLTMETTTEHTKEAAKAITQLSDEELKNAGLTEDEIELFRALAKESERTGESISDIAKRMSENDGRSLLIDSFKNIGNAISGVVTVVKEAWQEILNPPTKSDMIIKIYNMIDAFNKFTEKLRFTNEEGEVINDNFEKIKRTFKGVFALVDIIATVIGGPLKIAFEVVKQLLGAFDLNILDVTASIGDAIVKFRDWIDSVLDFTGVFEKMRPHIEGVVEAIRTWVDGLKNSENPMKYILDSFVEGIRNAGGGIRTALEWLGNIIIEKLRSIPGIGEWLDSLKESENLPRDIIAGLVNGLRSGVTEVWNAALEIGKAVLDSIKDFLGIHSPSTETQELGKNTIDGFVLGISNAGSRIGEIICTVFEKAIEFFKGRDFGGIIVAIFTGTVVKKLLDSIDALTGVADKALTPFQKLGQVFEGAAEVLRSFSKKIKAEAFETRANAIKTLVISLLLLVGAVIAIALIGPEKMWPAVAVIGALAVILLVLWGVTSALSKSAAKIDKDGIKLQGFTSGIIGIAAALLLVAAAVKMMGNMHTDDVIQGVIGIVALLAIMGGVLVAYAALAKTGNAKQIEKAGATVMKLSVAMLLLVMVAKSIARMSWGDMGKAAVGILGLVGIIALLVLISKIAGNKINSVGTTILKISVAMLLLVTVAKLISMMSWETMGKAAVGMLGLVGIITLLMLITKIAGKDLDKVGGTILALSVAMGALTFVAILLSTMSWKAMGKAAVGMVGLVGIVALLVLIVKMVKHDAPKIAGTILALSVSIALLGAVALLLGFIKLENLAKGVIAVGILGAMMALMIVATRGASDCHKNIMMMALAIGVMAVAIAALTFIKDTSKLIAATAALAIVMGMFALILKSGSNINSSLGTLIVMTLAVAAIAGVLYLLAQLPVESSIGAAIALSTLMLAVSAALFIVSEIGAVGVQALIGVGLLTAMAVPLLAFVGVLALMQNIQNAISNATVLIALATTMTLLLIPLILVGALWMPAAIGIAALTAMAVPLLAFVGVLALMHNIENATENTNLLVGLMKTLTGVLVVLAMVGPLALIGVKAMSSLVALMVAVGALAVAIGALMTKFPQLEDFLNKGIPVMEQLAHGIGSMIGNFVAGFSEAIFATLPMLGECLSAFMTNAEVFIAGAKSVDDKVLAGVGILAAAIIALTVADLVAGVTSFLTMGSSFADLGTELSLFMTNAMPFIRGASAMNEDMMNGVKALAETVLILTKAELIDGLASWLTGGSSLVDFGAQLGGLGTNLNEFATNLGTFDDTKVTTITCASNAIKAIASAAKELPNEGGWAAKLLGDNSIATFGSYLPDLGTNLAAFATNLGTFDEAKMSTVTCAADAIKAMAEAAKDIPNEGGTWAKLFGDNSLATFAENLPDVATNLAAFASNLGTFDDATVTTVKCAATAIAEMAKAAEGIDGQSEWGKKLFGDNSLASFGEQLGGLGTNLAAFASNLGTFSDDQVASVRSAVSAIKAFATLGDANLGSMIDYLPTFGSVMVDFGDYISDFCSNVSDIDSSSITTAVANINKLIDMANSITGTNSESLLTFGDAIKKLGKCGIDNFVTEFTSGESLDKAETAGEDLMDSVIKGIEKKHSDIKDAGEDSGEEAVDGMDNFVDDAKQAGKDLGDGLIKGIESKETAVYNAGFALGQKAIQGEKDGQKSNSPSKLTILAGKWIGEGLVIGMGNMARSVYNAGYDLGDTATNSISNTISKIADAVNTDLDVNPTIRPVLDLSDVESNAGLIGAMIGSDSLVGVSANVRAINATMNRRGQNGTNADVVTEIRKLRKGLDNVGNNVTNINGITYDDGSEVSNAVKVLVRAAKVERRR